MLENICYKSMLTMYYEVMELLHKLFHVYEETHLTERKEKGTKMLMFKKPFKCGYFICLLWAFVLVLSKLCSRNLCYFCNKTMKQ